MTDVNAAESSKIIVLRPARPAKSLDFDRLLYPVFAKAFGERVETVPVPTPVAPAMAAL
ncbi:hypothetical protein [Pelagibacterium montanilacus]|uniref:hypothetical protein n=1 Tax=Pelagibacterium montanilacus TaxID=2185280 RepID=UPI0013E0A5B4|nr:hypothetical protein [Pelagibacterium montanilacus]